MMNGAGFILRVAGPGAHETSRVLTARLIELGHRAEHVDAALVARLTDAAGLICQMLARNGVAVIAPADMAIAEQSLVFACDENDTPDFAAEKALDYLAGHGLVSMESHEYTPEEEEEIRRRLKDLGYIE